MRLSFNSIVPRETPAHSLSFTNLKSYLLSKKCDDEIDSHLFLCGDPEQDITEEILSDHPDIIAFSAYIWNIKIIERVSRMIKEKASDEIIIVGGPEVAYRAEEVLRKNPSMDIVSIGEGEKTLPPILEKIGQGTTDFNDIPGICYRRNGQIITNLPAEQLKLEEQMYEICTSDFSEEKAFLYETSRGCPFRCNFCTWQYTRGIRYYPMAKVMRDLDKIFALPRFEVICFMDSNILLNKKRALEIFRFINKRNRERAENKMPQVLPYFELNPEHFDDDLIDEFVQFQGDLGKMFTVKLGLQSTDKETLKICNRTWNAEKYTENYRKIINRGFRNFSFEIIHGLPGDTLEKYKKTLDFLISELNIDTFASYYYLVTPGSYFRKHAEEFGLVWENDPPYRLIRSNSFSEKDLEDADRLNYYLQLIFNALPRIKKVVDSNFKSNKLEVYEKVIDYISENYEKDFSPHKFLSEENLSLEITRMANQDYYHTRRKIIKESINIIKTHSKANA